MNTFIELDFYYYSKKNLTNTNLNSADKTKLVIAKPIELLEKKTICYKHLKELKC